MLHLHASAPSPSQSVTDFVFDTLYKAVVQLDLPPGARLSEAEVAERLQVSRQSARDAFFRLANRGFLLIRPQRATLVTKISEAEVLHACFIRTALETACIATAIERLTDSDIARLQDLLAQQEQAVTNPDASIFHTLDEEFHASLCKIAGQPKVWHLIQEQKGHMDRARFLSLSFNRAHALEEHRTILQALERRDTEASVASLNTHLGKLRSHLPQIRRAHAAFFEDEEPRHSDNTATAAI